MIRGIIFDCFGVLYGGSLDYLASIAPEGRVQEIYDINSRKDYGYISYDDYIAETSEVLGVAPEAIEKIVSSMHIRNEQLVDYVRSLRASGEYKIGLLSNIGEHLLDTLFGADKYELFDTIVLSFEEGIAKPHPKIFSLMAERMDLSEGECVMIDDLEKNCEGAEIAGMQSIRHISNASTIQQLETILNKKA